MDGQTGVHGETSIPPYNFVAGGIIFLYTLYDRQTVWLQKQCFVRKYKNDSKKKDTEKIMFIHRYGILTFNIILIGKAVESAIEEQCHRKIWSRGKVFLCF